MPKAKGTRGPKTTKFNKKEFILSFHESVPAPEIVAKAKEKGIEMPVTYVYIVRSEARRAEIGPGIVKGDKKKAEKTLRALVYGLGPERAREIVNDTEEKLMKVIAGGDV